MSLAVIPFLWVILIYLTDRTKFYHILGWVSGSIILVISATLVWLVIRRKRTDRRIAEAKTAIEAAGLQQEIPQFVSRFGTQKVHGPDAVEYRSFRFEEARINDFVASLNKRGLPIDRATIGALIREHIDEKEIAFVIGSSDGSVHTLAALSGDEFEELVGKLYGAMGFEARVVGRTGDQGADVIARRGNERILLQAKRYSGVVGNAAVQQAATAKSHYGCTTAAVITTSYFSTEARELARTNNVQLIDGQNLKTLLRENLKQTWN